MAAMLKVLERGGDAGFRLTHIAEHSVHEPARIIRIVSDFAASVHVDGQRRVPQLRQHVRPVADVVV